VVGERVVLRDGSKVWIGPVQPSDAARLAEGFALLSDESRRLRFLGSKAQLTAAEVRYLTEVDHHDHEALVAVAEPTGRGLGVARYIRDPRDPQAAELAITVIDEWQCRGLGTALLQRLIGRAGQEGIRRFTATVAAENTAVEDLLHAAGAALRVTHRGSGVVEYEITLPAQNADGLHALLRALARREISPPEKTDQTPPSAGRPGCPKAETPGPVGTDAARG
jgi:RimJ/RimL family protein N-acetyltransferase